MGDAAVLLLVDAALRPTTDGRPMGAAAALLLVDAALHPTTDDPPMGVSAVFSPSTATPDP